MMCHVFLIKTASPFLMQRSVDHIAKKAGEEERNKRGDENGQHA